MAEVIRRGGVPVDFVEVGRLRSLAGHFRVLSYLWRVRPDVIHTHLEFAHTLGGIYGRMLGSWPIGTVHTFAMGRENLEQRRLSLMWWSLRRAHRVVIAPSSAGLRHIRAVGRIPSEKLVVLHNGVDLRSFQPVGTIDARSEIGIPIGVPLIVTVAVLRAGKGVSDFVDAMGIIVSKLPNAMAIVVGDGPMRSALEAQTAALGLTGRVVFTGRRDDVADLLRASDLFVLPTHEDLLPTVVAEAMGTGLPVLASAVGGLEEMVDDGVTGFLFPPGDIQALASLCIDLLTDVERAKQLGASGRLRAENLFDIASQVSALENLYEAAAK